MSNVDLSRQLAKNQDLFRDTIRKNNETNQKNLSEMKDNHEYIQEKQREEFIQDKAELEKDYGNQYKTLNEKTIKAIEDRKNHFHEKMKEERDKFAEESESRRKDFDSRLKSIKSSYKKSFESEKARNKDVEESQKNLFDHSVSQNKKETTRQLKAFQKKMDQTGTRLKNDYTKDRRQMGDIYEDNLNASIKDAALQRKELGNRIQKDMKRTKDAAALEVASTKKHADDRIRGLEKDYQDRFRNMTFDYTEKNHDISRNQKDETIKTHKEHQDKITQMQRSFDNQLRDVELEKRRRENGSGEFAEIMKDQKGFNERIRFQKQVRNLENSLEEKEKEFNDKSNFDLAGYKQELKNQKKESAARSERKILDVQAEKLDTIANDREKSFNKLDNLKYQKHLEKEAYEKRLIEERDSSSSKYHHLQENFAKSIREIEANNKENFTALTKSSQKDKSEFIKKFQEQKAEEVHQMKREFNKMMDETISKYEKKIDDYKRDNEYVRINMENKIDALLVQTDKKIEAERKMYEERRNADAKAMISLQDQRDFEFKTRINVVNDTHQKKMDKMQLNYDSQMKFITNEYENKLKEVRNSQLSAITEKDANHKIELDRIKQAYDAERYGLVSAFENQIAELRKSHQNQIQELKEFKKLS